ncbi:hypothetical protein VPHD479_0273 [Vibrio phage D479]
MKRSLLALALLSSTAMANNFVNSPISMTMDVDQKALDQVHSEYPNNIEKFSKEGYATMQLSSIATCTEGAFFPTKVDVSDRYVKATLAYDPAMQIKTYVDRSRIRSTWNCEFDVQSVNDYVISTYKRFSHGLKLRILQEAQEEVRLAAEKADKRLAEQMADSDLTIEQRMQLAKAKEQSMIAKADAAIALLEARQKVAVKVLTELADVSAVRDQCVRVELLDPHQVMESTSLLVDKAVDMLGDDYNPDFVADLYIKFGNTYKETFGRTGHLGRNFYCQPQKELMEKELQKPVDEK